MLAAAAWLYSSHTAWEEWLEERVSSGLTAQLKLQPDGGCHLAAMTNQLASQGTFKVWCNTAGRNGIFEMTIISHHWDMLLSLVIPSFQPLTVDTAILKHLWKFRSFTPLCLAFSPKHSAQSSGAELYVTDGCGLSSLRVWCWQIWKWCWITIYRHFKWRTPILNISRL